MRFLLVMNQGGGCDYTIGCGINYRFTEADTLEQAMAAFKEEYTGIGNDEEEGILNPDTSERMWESAFVVTVSEQVEVPLSEWHLECYGALEAEENARLEKHERAQLAKLQAKYQ